MTLHITPIPILADNYAWLAQDPATGCTAIVDPAEAEPIFAAITKAGGRLDQIWLTHHHPDHIGAVEPVRARYGAPVYGAAADAARLPRLDQPLADGAQFAFGADRVTVIATPGHTAFHIVYFAAAGPALFCGDTLFSLGCGRLFEGSAADLFASLGRLKALPDATWVCCGHEYSARNAEFACAQDPTNPALYAKRAAIRQLRAAGTPTVPTILAEERALNPFLRAPDLAEFTRLRAARDRF